MNKKELDKLVDLGQIEERGEITCGGCDSTAILYETKEGEGQIEYCPNCGSRENA